MSKFFGDNGEPAPTKGDVLALVNEHKTSRLKVIEALGGIGVTLKDLLALQYQDHAEEKESVTIYTGQAIPFYSGGYRYNRLYIDDATAQDGAQLVIVFNGVRWTIDLVAGENKVNIPDAATIQGVRTSEATSFSGIFIRSNRE